MKKRTEQISYHLFRKNYKLKPIAFSILFAFGLAGCGNDTNEKLTIYSTVEDCVVNNPDLEMECKLSFKRALTESIDTAPKYNSLQECQADFGPESCKTTESVQELADNGSTSNSSESTRPHGSFWMPMLAGYMFGNMMNGGYANKPVYSPKDSTGRPTNFYDNTGKKYGAARSGSVVSVPKGDLKPVKAGTIRRGGFGQMVAKQNAAAMSAKSSSSTKSRMSFGG